MMGHESDLARLDFVADVLQPLQLIVWGELAMGYLGAPVVHNSYMLGVRDNEMALAEKKLGNVGFVREHWSFGSTIDPATRLEDKPYQRIHEMIKAAYANFDAKTMRFHYLNKEKYVQQVVIIPTSYIRLDASQAPPFLMDHLSMPQPPFYTRDNLHYPNAAMLLYSIISAYLEEREASKAGDLPLTYAAWAFEYLYGELSLRDDVVDGCTDDRVKEHFNKEVKRGSGKSRAREKWGKPRSLITNRLIKDFQ